MKLDKIIAKQEEHSLLLRRLLQTREEDTGPENPIPSIGQLPDSLSFEDKLREELLLRRLLQTREKDTGPENPIPSIGQLPDLLSFEDKLREELQRKTVKNLTFLFEAELNCMHKI